VSGQRSRILLAFEKLQDRPNKADAIANVAQDVREAAERLDQRLRARAVKFHTEGWVEEDDAEYALTADRTLVGRLRITRTGDN
jgi:hypothetical protein